MSKIEKQDKFYRIVLIISTIYSFLINYLAVKNMMISKCVFIRIVDLTIIFLYFIKEIWRERTDLKIRKPESNFIIECFWNINLLFDVMLLTQLYDVQNKALFLRLWTSTIIVVICSSVIRLYHFIKYSKDGKWFLFLFITLIILSLLNKNNLEIVTITTTLVTTVYGKTFLKNIFSDQITEYKVRKLNLNDSNAILDKLEYKLMKGNILLIIAHIIVFLTERIRGMCLYKKLLVFLGIEDSYFIGIFRLIILSAVYIISISKLGLRIKTIIFNFLMKDRNDI